MNPSPLEYAESLHIGTVEFVSPDEIKILLDIEAPESVALNAGLPLPFPRVNSYVLIPSDEGYLVGQVEQLTIERSAYPKRRGMKDFGLVDLPYPLRKMSLNPLGTLRQSIDNNGLETFRFRRGADAFPTVGDSVLLPTQKQLRSIVESGENRRVKIGTSSLAGNADIKVDPDRIFGRHLAVLGNTGSGKSCSVAGLIRWSLESVQAGQQDNKIPNARFIVLDPNGEYSRAFAQGEDLLKTRLFKVNPEEGENQLQVPLWFWNSSEWTSFMQASTRAQRPLLQKALRLRRNKRPPGADINTEYDIQVYLQGAYSSLKQQVTENAPFLTAKDGRYWGFLELLASIHSSLGALIIKAEKHTEKLTRLIEKIAELKDKKCKNERNYYKPFSYGDVDEVIKTIKELLDDLGGDKPPSTLCGEDTPVAFSSQDLLVDLEFLATNSGNRQWFDSLISRIQAVLTDTRMEPITGDTGDIHLCNWLTDYIGGNQVDNSSLTIIDMSLVPPEIIHIVTAVIARMIFEALQRYRKLNQDHKTLPTVLVMEEAHTFARRYKVDAENQDAASVCCQVFERIAREGRKFGLGLVVSSQRPSELSRTVLSQCNTFLLHRISNDRDQDLVHRFVPDNLKGLLRELPSLPSQNAILLGWASELPVLIRMNDLPKEQQPLSDDPDFWDVWTGKNKNGKIVERTVDWKQIAEDWQQISEETSEKLNDKEQEE